MRSHRRRVLFIIGVALAAAMALTRGAVGQSTSVYKARLGIVPVDANNQPFVTGSGTVTATLKGSTLIVNGTFSGLQSPATIAQVHVAPRGIRGPAVLDLTVTKASSGTIQGELMLTAAQIDHLRRGRLYVQLHSEKAADGNLWGWLLP
jgi:hypothetical protein